MYTRHHKTTPRRFLRCRRILTAYATSCFMIMMITAASGAVGEAHVPPCSVLVQFRRPKLYGHYSGTERCTRCATATSQSVWTAQPSFGFCASCAFSRGYTWGLTGDGPTQSTGGSQRQPHQNQRRRRRRRHSQRTATPPQQSAGAAGVAAAASRSAAQHYRHRAGDVVASAARSRSALALAVLI